MSLKDRHHLHEESDWEPQVVVAPVIEVRCITIRLHHVDFGLNGRHHLSPAVQQAGIAVIFARVIQRPQIVCRQSLLPSRVSVVSKALKCQKWRVINSTSPCRRVSYHVNIEALKADEAYQYGTQSRRRTMK